MKNTISSIIKLLKSKGYHITDTNKVINETAPELNDQELSKIDTRNDGNVEVIDVKMNNRKTRKIEGGIVSKDSLKETTIESKKDIIENEISTKNKTVNDPKLKNMLVHRASLADLIIICTSYKFLRLNVTKK